MMANQETKITRKLIGLKHKTGYPIQQINGQRMYGPPPDWVGPPPPRGCEVFIGKLPRDLYEDELVPVFSQVGKIYEIRLMMDFSGTNRGYGFVTYATKAEAREAIRSLHNYEIRPGKWIGVVKSVDNARLYIGGIPKEKTREEVIEEVKKHVHGVVDVLMYKNSYDQRLNRGFAFVEFVSHRAAALARRTLVPGCVTLWGQEIMVDWAEPEPDIDEDDMRQVKVLYARNFSINTSPEQIKFIFKNAINNPIGRVKKLHDYAFIHFHEREHAELAMDKLQNTWIDGNCIEIKWAKPIIDPDLYRVQKTIKGNKKYNNNSNLKQFFNLYKQHNMQRRIFRRSNNDEGIASFSATNSSSKNESLNSTLLSQDNNIIELSNVCIRYGWGSPLYKQMNLTDSKGNEWWTSSVKLPNVGPPLFASMQELGPFNTQPCLTLEQANAEAASFMLQHINVLMSNRSQHLPLSPPGYSCVVGPLHPGMQYEYGIASLYPPPPPYNYFMQQNYLG